MKMLNFKPNCPSFTVVFNEKDMNENNVFDFTFNERERFIIDQVDDKFYITNKCDIDDIREHLFFWSEDCQDESILIDYNLSRFLELS